VAAQIPALSPGWKNSFNAMLKADENGVRDGNAGLTSSIPSLPAWNGFRTLRVATVHQETSNVTSFVLEAEDRRPLPSSMPGQYLVLRLHPHQNAVPIIRSYSISGPPASGNYRITVKRGEGAGSGYLVDSIREGDLLEASAPRGNFVLRSSTRP